MINLKIFSLGSSCVRDCTTWFFENLPRMCHPTSSCPNSQSRGLHPSSPSVTQSAGSTALRCRCRQRAQARDLSNQPKLDEISKKNNHTRDTCLMCTLGIAYLLYINIIYTINICHSICRDTMTFPIKRMKRTEWLPFFSNKHIAPNAFGSKQFGVIQHDQLPSPILHHPHHAWKSAKLNLQK